MSRIGKLPITIPDKVKVEVSNTTIKTDGPKGKLEKTFNPAHVVITHEDNAITVLPASKKRLAQAMQGTARSIIASMVDGVLTGYSKKLTINGVGFRATVEGKILNLNLGYSHDINYPIPEGITVEVEQNTNLTVSGADKHMVGQVAADIYHYYPVEPYKGKGVSIAGRYVRRKEGKKAG